MRNFNNMCQVALTALFLLSGIVAWGQNSGYDERVERDRTRMIQIFGEEIKQDGTVIGKIEDDTKALDGNLYDYFMVYLPNGTMIAEASLQKFDSGDCRIITLKDNKEFFICVESTSSAIKKQIVEYLVKMYYL